MTVDRWDGEDAYERSRASRLPEYEALDREMEELTAKETPLGAFTAL